MCNFCCPAEEVFLCRNCQQSVPAPAVGAGKTSVSDTTVDDSQFQQSGNKNAKEVDSGGPTDGGSASAVGELELRAPEVQAEELVLSHDYPAIVPEDIVPGDLMVHVNSAGHHFAQLMKYTMGEDSATIRFGRNFNFGFLDTAVEQTVPLSTLYFPSSREAQVNKNSTEYGPPALTYLQTPSFFRHKSTRRGSHQDLHFMGEVSKLKRCV